MLNVAPWKPTKEGDPSNLRAAFGLESDVGSLPIGPNSLRSSSKVLGTTTDVEDRVSSARGRSRRTARDACELLAEDVESERKRHHSESRPAPSAAGTHRFIPIAGTSPLRSRNEDASPSRFEGLVVLACLAKIRPTSTTSRGWTASQERTRGPTEAGPLVLTATLVERTDGPVQRPDGRSDRGWHAFEEGEVADLVRS